MMNCEGPSHGVKKKGEFRVVEHEIMIIHESLV